MKIKICSKCKIEKSVNDFDKRSDRKSKCQSHCKACKKIYRETNKNYYKTYYETHKHDLLTYKKKWYKKNIDKLTIEAEIYRKNHKKNRKEYDLLRNYNINLNEYEGVVIKQQSICLICKKYCNKLYVDHCHKTNKIRGLLCRKCNIGIGHFDDDIEILISAITYLKNIR